MRVFAWVCLAALAAPQSILRAESTSEDKLRSEIEEHTIDPCLKAILGNIGLSDKISVEQYKRLLDDRGNNASDVMMKAVLPLISDLPDQGDRMEVYCHARFKCIEGAMKNLASNTPLIPPEAQRPKLANPKPNRPSFLEVSTRARKLVKQGHDSILSVSIGQDSQARILIVEVARNTATSHARTIGDDSLYTMRKLFAEFEPADYEVTVTRAGNPWKTKRYASPIWRGTLKQGARKVEWEQVIGDEPLVRKKNRSAVRESEAFDSVYESIFSPPKSE